MITYTKVHILDGELGKAPTLCGLTPDQEPESWIYGADHVDDESTCGRCRIIFQKREDKAYREANPKDHLISAYTKRRICSPDWNTIAPKQERGIPLTDQFRNDVAGRSTWDVLRDESICRQCRSEFGHRHS